MSTNKKNFLNSFVLNCVVIILLIEHLCGVELALEFLYVWLGISVLVHINILRDYIPIKRNKKK